MMWFFMQFDKIDCKKLKKKKKKTNDSLNVILNSVSPTYDSLWQTAQVNKQAPKYIWQHLRILLTYFYFFQSVQENIIHDRLTRG